MTEQRLPTVNGDDGTWGDLLNQFLSKEHLNTGVDFAGNGGHQHITVTAGTTAAGTAPIKLTSGALMTAAEAGAIEFFGDKYYMTITGSTTRKRVALYDETLGATGDMYFRNAGTDFKELPIGGVGKVLTVAGSPALPVWADPVLPASAGTAATKNTGNTVVDPGTGALEIAVPTTTTTGASKTYVAADRGKAYLRSNGGAAMTDTLPSAATVGNGFTVTVSNVDTVAAATLTLTSSSGTFPNGTTTFVLNYGRYQTFTSDGTNWKFVGAGNTGLVKQPTTVASGDFVQFSDSTGATINRTAANVRSDLGLAASATTDTTNAANIGSGTLPAGRLPALTGDITTTIGTVATTLATVNGNVGTFGSATQSAVVAVNAKGLTTSASNVTITPAVGSITGLGTGVATALGTNIGSAGSTVINGGALGTPSSGVATNLTGTASGLTAGNVTTNANLTGDVTSVGNATTLAAVGGAGTKGTAAAVPIFVTDAKGRVTSSVDTPINIAESQVSGLSGHLIAKADDSSVVHNTGAESIAGTKTFSSTPTFSAGATFTGGAAPGYVQGKLTYDTDNESLTFYNNDSNVSLQIGQEEWVRVKNTTGSTIANGSAVYFNGTSAGMPTIALAQANAAATTVVMGLTTESIANNAIGYITTIGVVHGLATASFTAGGAVYLSSTTAGGLTQTAPSAPNYRYRVGMVTVSDATVGAIHITPSTAALGNGSANQVFGMNAAGTAQEVKSIVGTSNISVTNTANTITLDVGSSVPKATTPTVVQTSGSTYNAQPGDLVLADASTATVTVNLPAAPLDKTIIVVKKNDGSINTVDIHTSGTDKFNSTSGGGLQQLVLNNQNFTFQYDNPNGVWYISGQYAAVAQLDTRYLKSSLTTAKGDMYVASTGGTVTTQAAGANNTILTADSTAPNGIKWTNTLTAPDIAAGSAAAGSALTFTAGTLMTTAEAGAFEYNTNTPYFTPNAGNRAVSLASHIITQTASFVGANVATAQKWFNTSTNGAITLPASTAYLFEGEFQLSRTAGTTSHTIGLSFGGTATLTSIDYTVQTTVTTGNVLGTISALRVTVATNTVVTAANLVATENNTFHLKGVVRINAAGTFIPQFQYSVAPGGTPTIARNSYFTMTPFGSDTTGSVGNWS